MLYVTARKLQEEDAASFFVLMTCQCPFNLPSRFVQLSSLALVFSRFFFLFVFSEKGRVLMISDVFVCYDYFINACRFLEYRSRSRCRKKTPEF